MVAQTTISNSTISGNKFLAASDSAPNVPGGGLQILSHENATTTILNATISGNETGGAGGGIDIGDGGGAGGQVLISHSTITLNRANSDNSGGDTGGGIHIGTSATNVTLYHTIVAGNYRGPGTTTADDISGTVTANWSFIGVSTSATIIGGNNQSGNPNLAPLAWNGGPTQTHRPNAGSLVIDHGNPSAMANIGGVPKYDQRGDPFVRVFNGDAVSGAVIDIGAYEYQFGRPKVVDVILDNVSVVDHTTRIWARDPYSFATLVPEGKQLAPIYTQGANTIKVQFSENVTITPQGALKLYRTPARYSTAPLEVLSNYFNYDPNTFTATWMFPTLTGDRYRIDVEQTLVHGAGIALDGSWINATNGTLYDWRDDPVGRALSSGNGLSGTSFRFLFAVLPGDYDQNGVVNSGDHAVWEDPQGMSDGDGDGQNGQTGDLTVLNTHAGWALFGTRTGDYGSTQNQDGMVTPLDYFFWKTTYGNTVVAGTGADGTNDGNIDTADYAVWRTWCNSPVNSLSSTVSAWYLAGLGAGSAMSLVDSTTAPRVTNVTISGSTSTHDPYSFATHVGSGEQLRTVPVGGADTISITFDEQVNIEADYLKVVGLTTANVPSVAVFYYDPSTMTAMWRFTGLVANDNYVISLSDAVTDLQGYRLDGEWVNPATTTTTNALISEFPSGNGHAGGSFNFVFTLLAGDTDLNNWVNFADYSILLNNYGIASATLFAEGDFSGNGSVSFYDYQLLVVNFYRNLQNVSMLGDLNGDHVVNDTDFETLRVNYGLSDRTYEQGDLNGDETVDMADVDLMFAQYGLELALAS